MVYGRPTLGIMAGLGYIPVYFVYRLNQWIFQFTKFQTVQQDWVIKSIPFVCIGYFVDKFTVA